MIVTISHTGYIKRTSIATYRKQKRGGQGLKGTELKTDDFVEHLFIAKTHDYLLVFTDDGRCFWLKVHEIPAGRARRARASRSSTCINVSPDTQVARVRAGEEVQRRRVPAVLHASDGTVKKTALSEYSNVRSTGIKAIKIEEGDELIDVQITQRHQRRRAGHQARPEHPLPRAGRARDGARHHRREGHRLGEGDRVVGMVVVKREATLLVVTEQGLGKLTNIDEYRVQKRGGKGILTVKRTERTGDVVALLEVLPEDEMMLITRGGQTLRCAVKDIRETGRVAQGVRLKNLDMGDVVAAVARLVIEDKALGEGEEGEEAGAEPQMELTEGSGEEE